MHELSRIFYWNKNSQVKLKPNYRLFQCFFSGCSPPNPGAGSSLRFLQRRMTSLKSSGLAWRTSSKAAEKSRRTLKMSSMSFQELARWQTLYIVIYSTLKSPSLLHDLHISCQSNGLHPKRLDFDQWPHHLAKSLSHTTGPPNLVAYPNEQCDSQASPAALPGKSWTANMKLWRMRSHQWLGQGVKILRLNHIKPVILTL